MNEEESSRAELEECTESAFGKSAIIVDGNDEDEENPAQVSLAFATFGSFLSCASGRAI